MELDNPTPLATATTLGLGPNKAPSLSVVLKGTFTFPEQPQQPAAWAAEQAPVQAGDELYDHSDVALTRLENELAPFKPQADIVLVGTAYAPQGRPAKAMDVRLRVGRVQRVLRVFGDRQWLFPTRMVMLPVISDPQPFTQMPLTYDRAFGGVDGASGSWCTYNYAGRGFIGAKKRETVHQKPLPNIEDPQFLIRSWDDAPLPAGFGYFGTHWEPRRRAMGTEAGVQQPHPLFGLPADFDPAFYNGAHPGLQVPGYLQGGEPVELVGLTPRGLEQFRLPGLRPTVHVRQAHGEATVDDIAEGTAEFEERPVQAVLDTLVLLPDERRLFLVWRAVLPWPTVQTAEDLDRAVLGISHISIRLAGS